MVLEDFFKNKRVLVTGHTGFKGAWLSIWLHMLGAKVLGCALAPISSEVPYVVCGVGDKVNSVTMDIRNLNSMMILFSEFKPEIVFHLAAQALVRKSYLNPSETFETNVTGTINVLESCRQHPCPRAVVVVTSDKCYEQRETRVRYRETDPMGGFDPYSASKGCAEIVSSSYLRSFFKPDEYNKHGAALATARAGNVIGGGDWAEDRLIPDCIRALKKGEKITIRYPEAVRPWQHVLEPLYGYLLLARTLWERGSEFSGAWNFGPDEECVRPVKEVVGIVARIWGETGEFMVVDEGEQLHESNWLELDCTKAKSKLNWFPTWNLKTSIEKAVDWYKAYFENKDMELFTRQQIIEFEHNCIKRQ